MVCRTAILGGHVQVCDTCGATTPIYHSCRNRHCPKCQSLDQARWVAAQAKDLLDAPYFHLVFTVPSALHPFFFADERAGYQALFATAMETLSDVARSRLGATPGTIAVLHTWTQTLRFHPHIHCIVTGGGLSLDRTRWIDTGPRSFCPCECSHGYSEPNSSNALNPPSPLVAWPCPRPSPVNASCAAASTPLGVVYSKAPIGRTGNRC